MRTLPYLLLSWLLSIVHNPPGWQVVWHPIFVHLVVGSRRARSRGCLRGTDCRNSLVSGYPREVVQERGIGKKASDNIGE